MSAIVQQVWCRPQQVLFAHAHNICETAQMTTANEERLGGRVGRLLEERGLSQDWLLQRVKGLSQQNLSNLITRNSKTSEFALRIAHALDVSPYWLLDGAGSTGELPPIKGTSETTTYKAVISFDSSHPEAPLLMRLLSAAEAPGINVEVKAWTENPEEQAKREAEERAMRARDRRPGPASKRTRGAA